MSYEVGYGRPPVATRFKKGVSGNQDGKRRTTSADVMRSILTDPVSVTVDGKVCRIPPIELAITSLFEKAMSADMQAAKEVLRLCANAGLFDEQKIPTSLICIVPKEWGMEEWKAMFRLHGPPPWKGSRDGLVPLERRHNPFRPVVSD